MNAYEELIQDAKARDFFEKISKMTSEKEIELAGLNLEPEEILKTAAAAIVYLNLSNAAYNDLLASYDRQCLHRINASSLPNYEKEKITGELIEVYRNTMTELLDKRIDYIASTGGHGKTLKDKDGKQKAKSEVKTWWEKWQLNPNLYKNKADFAKSMLDKFDVLQSQKVIEDWCREWHRNPAKQTAQSA